MDINLIDDAIYQGGAIDALPSYIQAVLDLRAEVEDVIPFTPQFKSLLWMPIPDGPPFPGIPWLETCVNWVFGCRQAGWPVLIHCAAGISRSGMVDVAYWMKKKGWSRDEALSFVRTHRPITTPNPYFLQGLLEYETFLKANRS